MRHLVSMLPAIGVVAILAACAPPPPQADAGVVALLDRQAIDQLVAGTYPRALDAQNWKAYADTYTEDGELVLAGQSAKTRAGIMEFLGKLPPEKINHVISNLSYKLEGENAVGGAYWQDIGLVNGAPGVIVAGHYLDSLRKVNGEWLFAKREIVIDFAAAAAAPAAPAAASQ